MKDQEDPMHPLPRRTFTSSLLTTLFALAVRRAAPAEKSRVTLFDPVAVGDLQLPNRMIMAPLTRGRAGGERTANALMAEYYAQRASAGLIITEATAISPQGYGWLGSPGIYTDAHIAGWASVTDAVHRRGGRIFLQLWHMGRKSHPDYLEGRAPLGPSAIAAIGNTVTPLGKKPFAVPRAMTKQEIGATVQNYARAAERARAAGFDGVEIHAGYGYLIDEFICDTSNRRTDEYGGSVENRLRLLLETTEAVLKVWPAGRVGVRLSPTGSDDIRDTHAATTFTHAAKALDNYRLGYLHLIEYITDDSRIAPAKRIATRMRAVSRSPFILNGDYDAQTGTAAVGSEAADMISYGRLFLANPDLVERFRLDAALNEPDPSTFYSGGSTGYTDYPFLHGPHPKAKPS
jgi:N-ethylmaleimide reductase